MTAQDYIARLRAGWPKSGDASLEDIILADEAVRAYPQSAQLWLMRGDLIQLGPESCPHPLEEALASYERAVQIAPEYAQAWDEIGHYYDGVLDDVTTARRSFKEAEKLRENHVE